MSEKPAQQQLEGYAEFVDAQRQEWKVPGCAIAAVKDGEAVFLQGFGWRDIENRLPVTPDTVFAIGSCTKAFTCAALSLLADEGKLDWDAPARDYLPELRLFDAYVTEHITPRDLVTHRSGLPRHDALWYGSPFTRREMFDRLRYLEPNKGFRAAWQYNNLMYMAAGVLIERVAGCTWEEFIQQRLFAPLGMTHSNLSITVSQGLADFAQPYHLEKDADAAAQVPFRNLDAVGPAGSINSSASDMAHWLLLNLNKGKHGGAQLISEASLQQMHAPHMAMNGAPEEDDEVGQNSYGLGWVISSYRGRVLVQHGGGIDGFSSLTTLLPRDGIGVVALTNLDGSPLALIATNSALDRLLGLDEVPWAQRLKERQAKQKEAEAKGKESADSARKLDTRPSHTLNDYAGDYEHPGFGRVSIRTIDGGLALAFHAVDIALNHYHYDVFSGRDEQLDMDFKVAFASDIDGIVSSVSLAFDPSAKPMVFTRAASTAMQHKGFLELFCGVYEVMGLAATVALQGETTLVVNVPGQPLYELIPVEGNRFKLKGLEGFSIEFKQDDSGRVTEAVFHQPNGTFAAARK